MEKMTKVMKLNAILEVVREHEFDGFDVVEFINHEVALLEKRNKAKSGNKKPSKTQVENMEHANMIFNYLVDNAGIFFSAKELVDNMGYDFTSQKMTALMKKVVELGAMKTKSTAFPKLVGYGIEGVEEEVQGE